MDGILNLYKPPAMSSARALDRVREVFGKPKSGHAGTLDPLAEGVLVICLGRATKLVEALMDQPKVYRTVVQLDVTSPSFDRETIAAPVAVASPPDQPRVADMLRSLEGPSLQVPPAASALKVRGQPAYKLSRAGRPPHLEPRPVHIYWTHIHRYEWPELDFELACGRGTYVRSIVRDIGERLNTGACMMSLVRRAVGPFEIDGSWTLERLRAAGDAHEAILPLEAARTQLISRPVHIPERPWGPRP